MKADWKVASGRGLRGHISLIQAHLKVLIGVDLQMTLMALRGAVNRLTVLVLEDVKFSVNLASKL